MSVTTPPKPTTPASRRRAGSVLRPDAAFAGVSIGMATIFVASGAPTPLLLLDQGAWHFASWTLTLAFGVYAFGLLASLLVVGSLSDHLGRRPVLIGSLIGEIVAMLMFLWAGDIGWVIAARVLQGLATGAATSAFSAAVVELAPAHRKRMGAVVGSLAPAGGLGLGALLAGAVAQFSHHPNAVVWGALAILMAAAAVVAALAPETVTPRPGAVGSLAPRVSVPRRARREFGGVAAPLIAGWMMAALFMGLVPTILASIFGVHSPFADGATAFIEPAVAAITALVVGRLAARRAIILGAAASVAGAGLVLLSVTSGVLPVLWAGGILGGIGFGATFSGAFRAVLPLAEAHERAGLFAGIYLVAYLAFGVPAIISGLLLAPLGLLPVVVGFAIVIVGAAAAGLGIQVRLSRRRP
jgi:MFS family permease